VGESTVKVFDLEFLIAALLLTVIVLQVAVVSKKRPPEYSVRIKGTLVYADVELVPWDGAYVVFPPVSDGTGKSLIQGCTFFNYLDSHHPFLRAEKGVVMRGNVYNEDRGVV
jgi:hypothetical protein